MGDRAGDAPEGSDLSLSWLGSRLRAPALPRHYVRRERLLTLLDAASASPIIVVAAPAGSGKSSLLADWSASRPGRAAAWLRLEEDDADASQLWAGLAAAMSRFAPQLADLTRPRRGQGEQPLLTILHRLEEDHPAHAVLIIDDVQVLSDDGPSAAALQAFLQSLPEWLHLVLLSRRVPPLPVDRLRVRGQLEEIGFEHLRFTPAEAIQVLTRLAPILDTETANAAAVAADGWIAGIQLTALAARTDRARAQGGATIGGVERTELLITDYVLNEVLAGERPDVVEVLVGTSVVSRVNASLAGALTGRADAGALLLEAEKRGLFVTRLGVTGWFETHAMVREILLRKATEESPLRVSALHVKAAQWLERAGETVAALQQWLRADRPRQTLRVLARNVGSLYDQGLEETISHTVAQLPASVAASSVDAAVELAWCLFLVDRHRFVRAVDQAMVMAAGSDAADPARGRLGVVAAIRALVLGDWHQAALEADAARRLLGDAYWRDHLGRFTHNLTARELALTEVWDEASAQVRACELGTSRDPERQLALEGTRALGQALAGHPIDALRTAAGLRAAAEVGTLSLMRTEFSLAQAIAHRELGDRSRAAVELRALSSTAAEPTTYAYLYALLELTELHLDEHDLDAAAESFESATWFVTREAPGPGACSRLARTGCRLALAARDSTAARRWADRIDDPFWAPVSRARVHLAEGDAAAAQVCLAEAAPRCLRHRVVHGLVTARASPHPSSVPVAGMVRAVASAGLLQTVATEVADSPLLLEALAATSPPDWVDRLRRTSGAGATALAEPTAPAERLTAREQEVLRLLPSRLTQSEIADELGVSVNTVKYHLREVYRKLGVTSRSDAAAAARRMARTRPPATQPGSRR